ncbi:MAG: tetratricopeptide repeat protein [Roseiarcus sp.]|jgi:TPR repeat protein
MSAFAFDGHRRGRVGLVAAARAARGGVLLALALALAASGPAFALDGSQPTTLDKIPLKLFKSAQQALRAGIDDLRAGDAKSSVEALKYAAAGGQSLAQWKLGRMYAQGQGVPHDDYQAYQYFDQLIEAYNEDDPERRDIAAVSNAFVAVGVYCLNGIANSELKPDPERALEMFQYAATNFGDPDAQYNLARMYMDGAAGLAKNNMRAARWLALAAEKHHHPAQAVLGHLLFEGDGVPRQRARGLMWLAIAKSAAQGPKDEWVSDLYAKDFAAASDEDRQVAALYLSDHTRGALPPPPDPISPQAGLLPAGGSLPPAPGLFGSVPMPEFDAGDAAPAP